MTPYDEGRDAYLLHRLAYEANPFLDYDRSGPEPLFSTWPHDAREWYLGWRDAALAMHRDWKTYPHPTTTDEKPIPHAGG
jgi:hypothetical protein